MTAASPMSRRCCADRSAHEACEVLRMGTVCHVTGSGELEERHVETAAQLSAAVDRR
jgi:hypothetical protein